MIARVLVLTTAYVLLAVPCTASTQRIVSLDGTTTEILAALGSAHDLVGRDDSSYYPAVVQTLPSIGYQFTLSSEGILSLHPSLVIGRASVKPQTAIDQVRAAGVPLLLVPDAPGIADAQQKIRIIAAAMHREHQGQTLIAAMRHDLDVLHARIAARGNHPKMRVLIALSISPQTVLACGPDSGPGAAIELADAQNALPTIHGCKAATTEAILAAAPDAIVLLNRGGDRTSGSAVLAQLASMTPAARSHREFFFDSLYIAGFGPRTGHALLDLFDAFYTVR